ncbi:TPA: hypothetical protein RQN22_001816 [Aeromonas dhakensis]|nr:hypothetical protein [Aeromonas dhakensis]
MMKSEQMDRVINTILAEQLTDFEIVPQAGIDTFKKKNVIRYTMSRDCFGEWPIITFIEMNTGKPSINTYDFIHNGSSYESDKAPAWCNNVISELMKHQ